MDEYIIKPFKINELYSIIENISKRFIRDGRYGEMQFEPINVNTATENEGFAIEDLSKANILIKELENIKRNIDNRTEQIGMGD